MSETFSGRPNMPAFTPAQSDPPATAARRARGLTETAQPPGGHMVTVDRRPFSNRRGFALEATLIMMILLTVLIGAGVAATMMVQRSASVDYRGARVTYAVRVRRRPRDVPARGRHPGWIDQRSRAGGAHCSRDHRLQRDGLRRPCRRAGSQDDLHGTLHRSLRPQPADRRHRARGRPAGQPGRRDRLGQRPVHPALPVRCLLRGRPRDP